jgi:biopolymer transport protein ExbB
LIEIKLNLGLSDSFLRKELLNLGFKEFLMELFYLLAKGGFLMIPIGIASVLGLSIVVERFISLKKTKVVPKGLSQRIIKLLEKKKDEEAIKILQGHESPLGRLLETVIKNRELSRSEMVNILEEKGRREAHRMGKAVEYIGVIASIAPLLGLLGTVTGMIGVFRQVMNDATIKGINPTSLASGIWEALVTTAAGLSVAIPLYIFYRILATRVDSLVLDLEEEVLFSVDSMGITNRKS